MRDKRNGRFAPMGVMPHDNSFSTHEEIHGLETREEHHSYGRHVNME